MQPLALALLFQGTGNEVFFRKKYTPDENVFVTESNVYDVFENLTDLGDIGDVGLTVEDTLATEIRSMRGEVVRYTELVDYGERIEENNKYWDFVVSAVLLQRCGIYCLTW